MLETEASRDVFSGVSVPSRADRVVRRVHAACLEQRDDDP